jgi:hypothetical protein
LVAGVPYHDCAQEHAAVFEYPDGFQGVNSRFADELPRGYTISCNHSSVHVSPGYEQSEERAAVHTVCFAWLALILCGDIAALIFACLVTSNSRHVLDVN